MAGNTYKSTEKKKKRSKKAKFSLKTLVDDRRVQLTTGLFLVFLGVCMFLAFTSYLFSGNHDQSAIENSSIYEGGLETENWLGYYGALLSHLFIFKWFGIAAYLFVPILTILGYGILFKKKIKFFWSLVTASIFFLFWTSTTLGYYYVTAKSISSYDFLSGGIGFELAASLHSWFGFGAVILLIFALAIFVIFFFNVTSLLGLTKKSDDEELEEDEETVRIEDEHQNFAQELNDQLLTSKEELEGQEAKEEESLNPEDVEMELKVIEPNPEEQPEITTEESLEPAVEEPVKEEEKVEFALDATDVKPVEQKDPEEELEIAVEQVEEEEVVEDLGKLNTNYDPTLDLANYEYPSLDLMEDRSGSKVTVTREELEANKDNIVSTLANYKIGISSIKSYNRSYGYTL